MAVFYSIPQWFFFLGVGLEIIFAIIAGTVAGLAFSIYRSSKEKNIRTFGVGFLGISLAYLIWAGMHLIITTAAGPLVDLSINNAIFMQIAAVYCFMALFIIGLVSLAYATFGVHKGELYYLILGLSLTIIAVSLNKLVTFRIVCVFLLSFLVYQYFRALRSGNRKTKVMFTSFVFLLLANLDYLLLPTRFEPFVIGHILELTAYILILITLVKSIKNG